MTMLPYYDSPDKTTRKIIYYVCDKTGKCFDARDISQGALAASIPLTKKTSRLDKDLSLTELFGVD